MPGRPDLVVHIGAGKTGSSAIQWVLGEMTRVPGGAISLGTLLEALDGSSDQPWILDPAAFPIYWDNVEKGAGVLHDILEAALVAAKEDGSGPLVWSNESILEHSKAALLALSRLRTAGYNVRVICYVRRHDAWAESAYMQWGIRHKCYEGPIRPFRDWAERAFWRGPDFRFFPLIRPWHEAFRRNLILCNYDAHSDVVRHFFGVAGIQAERTVRVNTTPPPEVLVGYALFNNGFESAVVPDAFEERWRAADKCEPDRIEPLRLDRYLPGNEDLAKVRRETEADRQHLNNLLAENGEPAIEVATPLRRPARIDHERLAELLARLWLASEDDLCSERHAREIAVRELAAARAEIAFNDRHPFSSASRALVRLGRRLLRKPATTESASRARLGRTGQRGD